MKILVANLSFFCFFFKNEHFNFVSRFIDQSIFTERFLYELIDDKDINNISDILYNTKNPSMFIHKNNPNKERLDSKLKEIYDDPIKKHKFDIITMLVHKFNNLLCELENKHHNFYSEKYIFSGNYGLLYLKYLNKFLKIYHPELKNFNKDTKNIDIFLKSCDEDISENIMNIFLYPIISNYKSANKLNN